MFRSLLVLGALASCHAIRYKFNQFTKVNDDVVIFHQVAQGVDARVEYSQFADDSDVYVDTYDVPKSSTGSDEAMQVRLEGIPRDSTQLVNVNITFYEAAKGISHKYSDNFEVCFVDLDGTNNRGDNRGSCEIGQIIDPKPTQWNVEADTSLQVTELPGLLQFKGAYEAMPGIDVTATHAVGCAFFNAEDHVHLRIGYTRSSKSSNTYRLFSINMFDAVVYAQAASALVDLPDMSCAYSVANDIVYKCKGEDCRISESSDRGLFTPITPVELPRNLSWVRPPASFATSDGTWEAVGSGLLLHKGTRVFTHLCECDCEEGEDVTA